MLFRFHTVRTRLGWLAFGPLVLVLVIGGLGLKALVDNVAIDNALSFQAEVLSHQNDYIELWFSERSDDVKRLAGRLSESRGNREAMIAELQQFEAEEPQFTNAIFRSPDGTSGFNAEGVGGADVSDRDYFQVAIGGEPAISGVLTGRVSGDRIIIFAHPVTVEGDVVGVAFAGVPLVRLEETVSRVRVRGQGETYILRVDGVMITESKYEPRLRAMDRLDGDSQMNFRNQSEIYRRATNQDRSFEPYRSYWGARVIGNYLWANQDRWILVYEQPVQSVLGRYDDTLRVAGLIAVVLAVLLAIALYRVEQTITTPIHRLSDATQSYFNDEEAPSLNPEDFRQAPVELKQLADAFKAMRGRVESDISRIEESSRVDGLTGLMNRRHFELESQRLLEFCARSELPVSVVMLDIDHFKSINDTYGHAAGDVALRSVAAQLRKVVRDSDVLARWGGEEFAVFSPNANAEQARELAERVRASIEKHSLSYEGQTISMTTSVGLAGCDPEDGCAPETDEALSTLISKADRCLYEAKRSGRNRVVTEDLAETV